MEKPQWSVIGRCVWRLTYNGKSLTLRRGQFLTSVEDPETETLVKDGLTWVEAKKLAFEKLGVPDGP